jgi:hypothetical protein
MDVLRNNSYITDNSLSSKETEDSMSFENSQVKNINEYIINAISLNLKEIITENESQSKYAKKDIFYLSSLPSISLNDYIKRIMKYSKMDISSLINAIIYLDRFCNRNNYILTKNNIFFALLTACLISIKFNEDYPIKTQYYCEIAGIPFDYLKKLEIQMYFMLNCSLIIKYNEYKEYYEYFSNSSISKKVKNN